ncbi:MAG: peptidylprolyl isomerase [Thermodesulfovibrionales bacterium]|jgi:peptidyl-prolyl cis-trans isomerase SurA
MMKRVFCAVVAAFFMHISLSHASPILLDKVMAIVNKEVITWSDLYKTMEFEAGPEVKAMSDEEKRRFFKANEMMFLDALVDMRLQLQAAANAGVRAGKEDVDRAVEGIKKKYSMTDEAFIKAIREEGFSPEEYRKKLADQITIARVVDQEIKSKLIVTEKEIDTYLTEHSSLINDSNGFDISHIYLKKSSNRAEVEERAQELYKKIKAGEDFGSLARQHSEDGSAKAGGELGFIKKTDLSKDFLDVLAGLKAGDVSEPFWSGNGMHIIRLNVQRVTKDPKDLREAVRQKLLEEKFKTEYSDWLKGLREKSYVEIKI